MKDNEGRTPLHDVCEYSDDLELVKLLIEAGGNVNEVDSGTGKSLMHLAYDCKLYWKKNNDCKKNNLMVMKLLVANGIDLDIKDSSGETVLHQACRHGRSNFVKFLIDNGASVHSKDTHGTTPLHCACRCSDLETVKLLKEHGADMNAKDSYGNTPLHLAYELHYSRRMKMIKWFIENGVDVNAKCSEGWTILHRACIDKNFELVKLLVENGGADVDIKDNEGMTALFWACKMSQEKGSLELVQYSLSNGANVCAKTIYGTTPLHEACKNKCLNTVWHLVRHCPLLMVQSDE